MLIHRLEPVTRISALFHLWRDISETGPITGNLHIVANRPFPSSKKSHFQNEAKCETFVVKMSFICIIIENHFHINGFALSLVLKVRFFGTRKWPIWNASVTHLFPCSWLSDDVCHKCAIVSPRHVKTLFGSSWPHNTVTRVWSYNMVAGIGLVTAELVERLPGLSVL